MPFASCNPTSPDESVKFSRKFFAKISWIGPWVSRLIDVKGIDLAQPIYSREAVRHKLKNG